MKQRKTAPNRKVYRKPGLVSYGSLQDLTTGGSGQYIENTGKDSQPYKRA